MRKSYAREAISVKGPDATLRLISYDKAEDRDTKSYTFFS